MYYYLKGTIVEKNQSYIVVDVLGVGYQVYIVHEDDFPLFEQKMVYLYHVVREDEEYFFSHLEEVKDILSKDIEMFYESDPACESYEEVILTYPGFYAIYVHRVAHILYELKIPLIPRMMSEYAHSKTGIDIHPGAKIGNYFFIDHGTGIVIGETTLIGERVKIYQGVTLGALSLKDGQRLKGSKRHPTIGNNVTIYSGASILGGDTVIGDNVTIGSSVFLTYSVPSSMKVINKAPELILKEKKED